MQAHLNTSNHEDRFAQLCRNIDEQLRRDPGCANRGAEQVAACAAIRARKNNIKTRSRTPARTTRKPATRKSRPAEESGDDGGGGDPEPAGEIEAEHAYTRRGLSYSDQHTFATYDPADPAPQIARTLWPVIPDPYSYLNVCESSWRRLSQFAGGRAREVCRLLGDGEADFDVIGERLLCSDRTARDDARKIFHDVVAGRVDRQRDLLDSLNEQYIPRRSTRGRKKKARTPVPERDAVSEGGEA